jgi:hypothetical protein
MKLTFEYLHEQIPIELKELTDMQIGNSYISNVPVYEISFNVNSNIIRKILRMHDDDYDPYTTVSYLNDIKKFILDHKIRYIYNSTNDDMNKFVLFLQFYVDYFNNIFIIK